MPPRDALWVRLAAPIVLSLIAITFLLPLRLAGRIRHSRLDRLAAAYRGGGPLIIAANHPSLMETAVLPLLFWPRLLIDRRLMPFSLADRKLLPPPMRWLYPLFRVIPVDRDRQDDAARAVTKQGILAARDLLAGGAALIVYPEGGRTAKGEAFLERNGRSLRVNASSVPRLAAETGAAILPVWIDFPLRGTPRYFASLWQMIRGARMTVRFGEPYRIAPGADLDAEHRRLAEAILAV